MSEWVDGWLRGWVYNGAGRDCERTTCPERPYVPGDKTADRSPTLLVVVLIE